MTRTTGQNNRPRHFATMAVFLVIASVVILALILLITHFSHSKHDHAITRVSCADNLPECYDIFVTWQYSFNQRVLEWSLSSGKMIFWISMGVTLTGLIFCFFQFWEASNIRRRSEVEKIQFKTEAFSVALKTQSIGALILFVSVIYLVIYAKFIYPINMVDLSSSSDSQRILRTIEIPKDQQIDEEPSLSLLRE